MIKNRGITLVALVITVIILLVLAGIAISAITGEEGLFSKVKQSGEKYNNAAYEEKNTIDNLLGVGENKSTSYEDFLQLIKNNAIGYPKYDDANRVAIVSGTEYTADENVWLIVNSANNSTGSLEATIDGIYYLFCQAYDNVDWSLSSQGLIPIKKGSKYKLLWGSGMTVYKVGMSYNVERPEKDMIDRQATENALKTATIGFPKYIDTNRTTIVSGTEYTADKNIWIISSPNTDGSAYLTLTINGVSYNFSKSYSGKDYSHPTNSMIPIEKGSQYKLTFSGTTVYKVDADYAPSEGENKTLEDGEIVDIISKTTIGFPNYSQENRTTITNNQTYVAEENLWLVGSSVKSGSGYITITINGATYNFYQGYSGSDYNHPTQSMIPIMKGSTYNVAFGNCTIYKLGMSR